jgi:hypothetical protein
MGGGVVACVAEMEVDTDEKLEDAEDADDELQMTH